MDWVPLLIQSTLDETNIADDSGFANEFKLGLAKMQAPLKNYPVTLFLISHAYLHCVLTRRIVDDFRQ